MDGFVYGPRDNSGATLLQYQQTPAGKPTNHRCVYLISALFVVSLTAVLAAGGYIVYMQLERRHWEDSCYQLQAACDANSPGRRCCCFWNRTKETGRIIFDSLASTRTRESVDNSFHVSFYEPSTDVYQTTNADIGPLTTIVTWFRVGIGCRVGPAVHYDEVRGQFRIARSGNYALYSHVTFQPPPDVLYRMQKDGESLTFSFATAVAIWRNGHERQTEVLRDRVYVTCPSVQRFAGRPHPCHVSDQAAILWLEQGDLLSLEAAPLQYVLGDLRSSYFGAVLLY